MTSYADIAEKAFKLIPNIIIKNTTGRLLLVLDTKYKKLDKSHESGDRDQVTYSLFMKVSDIGLLYSGRKSEEDLVDSPISLKQQINLHLLMFNLKAYTESEFEQRCSNFIKALLIILRLMEIDSYLHLLRLIQYHMNSNYDKLFTNNILLLLLNHLNQILISVEILITKNCLKSFFLMTYIILA